MKDCLEQRWPLRHIYAYLTDGCNLKCRHCYIAPQFEQQDGTKSRLNPELLYDVIKQAKSLGLNSVKLTGGEPLLHEQLLSIIDYIVRENLHLQIETNGVLCTKEIAKRIARAKSSVCSISLDGADAKTHEWMRGVPGCFDRSISGITNLVNEGISVQIITCLNQVNYHQIETMTRLAEKLGVYSLKFNVINPSGRGKVLEDRQQTISIKDAIDISYYIERDIAPTSEIDVFVHLPLAFGSLSKVVRQNYSTCALKHVIGLLPNGSYALCGMGLSVPGLVFGDAGIDALDKVWCTNKTLNKIREEIPVKLEGVCGNCMMKNKCLGHCIAHNFFETQHLNSSYWFCEAAYKAGLFPESRLINFSEPLYADKEEVMV